MAVHVTVAYRILAATVKKRPTVGARALFRQTYRSLSRADHTPKGDSKAKLTSRSTRNVPKSEDTLQPPAAAVTSKTLAKQSSLEPQLPLVERLTILYNESSGEKELSSLKDAVSAASRQFDKAVQAVHAARHAVDVATSSYDAINKDHNALLMRRESWDGNDAMKFADLTVEETAARKALVEAREALRRAEDEVSVKQVNYIDAMRKRYHEEQIWQDKWRVLGTYGTWGLIGLNTVIFIGGQIFHFRREAGRLKRIEDLIRESNSAGGSAESIGEVADSARARAFGTMQQEQPSNDIADVVQAEGSEGDIEDTTGMANNHHDQEKDADIVEEEPLVYNDVTCPSDAEIDGVMHKIRRSRAFHRARTWLQSMSSSRKGGAGTDGTNDTTATARKAEGSEGKSRLQEHILHASATASATISNAAEEIHWPSAAAGALASAVCILLVIPLSGVSRR